MAADPPLGPDSAAIGGSERTTVTTSLCPLLPLARITSSHYGFSGGVDLVAGGLLLMLATEMNILSDGGATCEILLPKKVVAASFTLCHWIPSSPTRPPSDPVLSDKATIGSPPLRHGHGENPSGRVRLDISRVTLAESSPLDSTNYSNRLVDLDHHRLIPRVGVRAGGHFPPMCQPLSASVIAWESSHVVVCRQ
ncbi:hypothetical protein D1007_02119 [Hordeum vulgare]|nr:hypothetical protein D1007_02119 [Hordeum vulgare]